jgi:hypothetical protein
MRLAQQPRIHQRARQRLLAACLTNDFNMHNATKSPSPHSTLQQLAPLACSPYGAMPQFTRRLAAALIASCIYLGASEARAASPAEQAFIEGKAAAKAGDYALACSKFEASHKLEPAPGTLFNLGQCSERLGRLLEAAEYYRLGAAGLPRTDQRRTDAAALVAGLEARVAHLTLRAGPELGASALVLSGGRRVERNELGKSVAMNPGEIDVLVTEAGHDERHFKLTLRESASESITLESGPLLRTESPKAELPPPKTSSSQSTVGAVVLAVGATSLAVGAVSGILALGAASTYSDNCVNKVCRNQEGLDAARSLETLSPLSTWTLIGGAVLATVGITILVTAPSSKPKPPVLGRVGVAPGNLHLSPFVQPTAHEVRGGFVLAGTF